MNRVGHVLRDGMPKPVGAFAEWEAMAFLCQYRKNPAGLACPTCNAATVEVLAFIDPKIDPSGYATITEPVGEYAVALFCNRCHRAIGILASLEGQS